MSQANLDNLSTVQAHNKTGGEVELDEDKPWPVSEPFVGERWDADEPMWAERWDDGESRFGERWDIGEHFACDYRDGNRPFAREQWDANELVVGERWDEGEEVRPCVQEPECSSGSGDPPLATDDNDGNSDADLSIGNDDISSQGSGRPSRGRRCPLHLRGKEIGLWYKNKKVEETVEIFVQPSTYQFMSDFLRRTTSEITRGEEDHSIFSQGDLDPETFEGRINSHVYCPKERDFIQDMVIYADLALRRLEPEFAAILEDRANLPAGPLQHTIVQFINQHQVTVICGATGCGKTTQVPQFILDDFVLSGRGSICNIVCTQPRRISAISVAERVAYERMEPLMHSVGYQIRLDNKLAERKMGCINFVTAGMLLQWMVGDPVLQNISHVFLDEVHERAVESDAVMALLKYVLPKRPDLKIVLMSATVNAQHFSKYFADAPVLEIPGRMFPVQEYYLEDILTFTNYKFKVNNRIFGSDSFEDYVIPYVDYLKKNHLYSRKVLKQLVNPASEELDIPLVAELIRYICMTQDEGAILVFLPGLSDLSNLHKELKSRFWYSADRYLTVLVHSMLPSIEQREVFVVPKNKRKIIISTAILETSVTVDDVVYVIDCGKRKLSGYDLKHKVPTLHSTWITMANAVQRKGRAGRTKPGKCYKLYTRARQQVFDQFPTPEIQTTNLEQVILEAKALKIKSVTPFLENMMDPPEREMIDLSLTTLMYLNALDSEERLTPLGYCLSRLPMDPGTGKMIIMAALFSCIEPIFSIAACLSFKDPFTIPLGQEKAALLVKESLARGEKSDHIIYSTLMELWENERGSRMDFCHRHFLSYNTMTLLSDMRRQFADILYSMKLLRSPDIKDPNANVNSDNIALVKAIICAGLYPNMAVLKKTKKDAFLKTLHTRTVRFHIKSYCYNLKWTGRPFFVYHHKLKSTSVFLHDATMVSALPLLLFSKTLDVKESDDKCYLAIDRFLIFETNKEFAELLMKVKNRMDWIVGTAIMKREFIVWDRPDPRSDILKGIVTFITDYDFKHLVKHD